MTKHLTLLLFIGLAWGQDITIAVFDFENNGLKEYEVRQLATRLESELVKIGGFKVVERTKIDEILKEQKFQMSGCIEECLIDVGNMLGANQIVLGSVAQMGGLFTISVKLVDAESGELIQSSDFDADLGLSQLLKQGLKEIAYDLTSTVVSETIPIYRFYHKKNKEHFYTTNQNPAGNWKPEGIEFYAYDEKVEGTIPIYRFLHKDHKDHFYTKNSNPKGHWKAQGIEFYAYDKKMPGTVPIYRFYCKWWHNHFYTTDPNPPQPETPIVPSFVNITEDPDIYWKKQGIEFYAYPNPTK